MSIASKLFGMWLVGKTVSSTTPLFMRLLMGMVAMTIFAVFCAVLTALLMIGGVWFGYLQMVDYGMEPHNAALVIAGILMALLSAAVMMLQSYWKRVRAMSKMIIFQQAPLSARAADITNAFMEGFSSPQPSRHRQAG